MKKQLYLHEAIVIALINIDKETFAANFDAIAAYITAHNLYPLKHGARQVMMRSRLSNKHYHYLFEQVGEDTIQLKNKSKPKIKKALEKPSKKVLPDLSDYKKDKKPIAELPANEQILY